MKFFDCYMNLICEFRKHFAAAKIFTHDVVDADLLCISSVVLKRFVSK